MNDVLIDESKIFDACGLVEEIAELTDITVIKQKVNSAALLLNQALENAESSKKDRNELTTKDIMCVSRVVQSALFDNPIGIFYGCKTCPHSNMCEEILKKSGVLHFDSLRKKLQEITGVDLNYSYNPDNPEAKFK
jgi:hypothetical protein